MDVQSAVRVFLAAIIVCFGLAAAQAPRVTLTGFAVLPADTLAPGPPSGAWLRAGKEGIPQFASQTVQGFSSLRPVAGDQTGTRWWVLADNGFGAKLNSQDFLLRLYQLEVTWATATESPGAVRVISFVQLADPDRRLPFPIARGDTPERWLTGADLDPESVVLMPDGSFWIGDEFGPFLVHVGADGRIIEPPFEIPGVRGPDHPHVAPADAGQVSAAQVRRSRGFEGLAHSGTRLYAALEGGFFDDKSETHIYEFDLDKHAFTYSWRYPFEAADHALTEFVALHHLSEDCRVRFLAIERDGGHGLDAKFKRVYEVLLNGGGSDISHGSLRTGRLAFKRLVVDLLAIDNPQRLGGFDLTFTFPFITTEAVWATAPDQIVLANDNNFPAGGGRPGAVRDATEFIRLALPTPLCTARMTRR